MRKSILLICLCLALASCGSSKHMEEKNQKLSKLHYQMGIDALNKNLLPKAFQELLKADELKPNQADVEDALAYAWRLRGNLEKSEKYYKKSLAHSPQTSTQNNYGSLLIQMKRYKDAETVLRKALQDPGYLNQNLIFLNLGDALLEQGNFEDAIKAYRQARRFQPEDLLPQIKEANAYIRFDRLNYARAMYETLLRSNKDNRFIAEGLLGVLKKQNDRQAARDMLKTYRQHARTELDKAWALDEIEKLR
ncbi:MAG TPA: tetratricopeptide repeat protein [Mariprofundaceae bacterium]|nr:tetratricopeptide repeat protein [Mariprofundaceae bacterium]